MSDSVFLKSFSFVVDHPSDSQPIATGTLVPGALSFNSPNRSNRSQQCWNYLPTPVPSARSSSVDTATDTSMVATERKARHMKMVQCLVYYRNEENKLRKKLLQAEVTSDSSLHGAIKMVLSYFGTLKRLKKTAGRLYKAKDDSFHRIEEINWMKHGDSWLYSFHPDYLFVFDTADHVAKDIPVTMEEFPLWYM